MGADVSLFEAEDPPIGMEKTKLLKEGIDERGKIGFVSCTTESATPHELQTTRVNCAVWLYEDGMPDAAVLVLISNRTCLLRSSRRDIQVGLCTV